jgi:hypothetical protein
MEEIAFASQRVVSSDKPHNIIIKEAFMAWELAAEVGYELIKVAESKGLLNNLKDLFRKKHRILLMGSSGTGKTQFIKCACDIFADAIDKIARTEFPSKSKFNIDGRLFEFIDTPGQKYHKARRSEAFRESLSKGISGVINIVAYGYHEYDIDVNKVITNNKINTEYQKRHLQLEIDLLQEWAPYLKDEWIITVVSKADLWWNINKQVLKHYSQGPYQEALEILNQKSDKSLKPFCSTMSKFFGVIPCSGEFDDALRKKYRKAFFTTLLEAITREKI